MLLSLILTSRVRIAVEHRVSISVDHRQRCWIRLLFLPGDAFETPALEQLFLDLRSLYQKIVCTLSKRPLKQPVSASLTELNVFSELDA